MGSDESHNGAGAGATPAGAGPGVGAPGVIKDLAEACIQFVERSLGVKLDYEPETLPVLDHYLEQARTSTRERPEALAVVIQATGAYFGEVLRRRHASFWHLGGGNPQDWQLALESVYLAVRPMQLMADALYRTETSDKAGERDGEAQEEGGLELLDHDRAYVAARLAEMPLVTDREFYAPSTRLEVVDIVVEAIQARRLAEGQDAQPRFSPEDYDT